jgi:signal peptidase I
MDRVADRARRLETASEQGVLDAPSLEHPLRRSPARKLKSAVWLAVAGLAVALAALMLGPAALGYDRYVITGDSMSGSIPRGSIVFDEEVPVSDLREGDVITYDPPASSGVEGPVTHRIDTIGENHRGETRFRTTGDGNRAPDPWTFTLDQPTQARVSFHLPYVGFVYAALSIGWVRMLLIGLPALLIALALLSRVRRPAGEELERRGRVEDVPAPATPVEPVAVAMPVAAAPAAQAPQPLRAAPDAAAGLPGHAFAPSPSLLADVTRDVERLRESSGTLVEGLVRLRGRLENVEPA